MHFLPDFSKVAARARLSLPIALAAMTIASIPAHSAEVDVHGYLLGTASSRISGQPLNTGEKGNWLLAEERLQLEVSAESDAGDTALVAKIDALNDNVSGSNDIDVRELYGEYFADTFELRIGRQMLTWGVADRLFINDVFPKDWSAFFSGQPLEYMKLGSDMAKLFYFGNGWDLELALIPVARFDVTPQADRYVVYSPPGVTGVVEPEKKLANGEVAARFHTKIGSTTDFALHAFKGFWHQPDKGMAGSTIIYPRLNTYGFTVQDAVLGGVLSLEGGFYHSIDDANGTNPMIANSQYRYLVAYEHELMTDVTLAVQWYGEIMKDHGKYLPAAQGAYAAGFGPKPQPRHRKIVTANLRALWMNQTLTTSLFVMGVGDGGGRMYNPDVKYAVTDEFSVNVGGHVFTSGPDSWMLGMMKHDDNAYVNVKWTF